MGGAIGDCLEQEEDGALGRGHILCKGPEVEENRQSVQAKNKAEELGS